MSSHDGSIRSGRANLYQEITSKIITELEAGRVPWVQPWGTAGAKARLAMPKNAATGRGYSGINVLILWGAVIEHGFPGQSWLTFRQALSLGGNVRKGERGTTVVYADRFIPDGEKERVRETGEEARAIPFLKRFTVFNAAQCDGLTDDVAAPPLEPGLIEPRVEALIKAIGIDFRVGGSRAFYTPAHDYVQVPPPQAYFEPIDWHRTALHELGHASGAPHRLNRDLTGSFGSKKYAFEELVAEMNAAFCCASLGIVPTVRHADYIGSWLEVLREDNRAVFRAAGAASKAADFILSFQPNTEVITASVSADNDVEEASSGPQSRESVYPGSAGWRHWRVREPSGFRDGLEAERKSLGARRGETEMATAIQKITLSASRDIPFNKLVLSQSNVRRIKAGVSIEELAEDIARRTLLQSITVRPVRDADGNETGMYEIPAGGRRYRALELLVKRKRLAKTAPVPCVVREGGIAEEDSLAENIQRAPLHPLDQFRAFLALREKGQSEEEIAAAFFISVAVVRQRLRLASVSLRLLDIYAEDGLTLDQLMAFTVNGDHARQEQVFDRLSQSHTREPYAIRRMLTEGAVRAADKRAQFIGLDAYEEAGGVILHDLFQGDGGGWLQDVALVDRLVAAKLEREAEAIHAEGWKWIEIAPEFAYGHSYGLRQLRGEEISPSAEEKAARDALQAEYDRLEETHAEAKELPEDVDQRLAEIETALLAFEDRPVSFDRADIAHAGAFVSIDAAGNLRVERGYVRPEDENPVEPKPEADAEHNGQQGRIETDVDTVPPDPADAPEPEEDDGLKPIPDRLMTELTAHRTLALRHALGERPDVAYLAALHAFCVKVFYRYAVDSCLEIDVKSVSFGAQAPGLKDTTLCDSFDRRHHSWIAALPKEPTHLWDALAAFDEDSRQALFAHCVSLSVNAMFEPYNRRPRAIAHADRLAEALDLDMVAAGWVPTVDAYLGRVTKARILGAVREAKGERAARLIDHLKKVEMAERAQELLAGSGWLPEPLRTPGRPIASPSSPSEQDAIAVSDAASVERTADGDETAMVESEPSTDDEPLVVDPCTVAAE